ncbi:MAG: LytTR family transcriptional regulator [Prevotellaceae bacterium]|jgi:hypothetical protein|nr:LytTR family transcriptional regulator [Prevotellaceae bacterium]
MTAHPFVQSRSRKIAGTIIIALLIAIVWAFLVSYGNMQAIPAIVDGLFYIESLALTGYFYWYIIGFIYIIWSKIVVALLVQLVSLGVTLMLLTISGLESPAAFMPSIPLHLIIGLSSWVILLQWYQKLLLYSKRQAALTNDENNLRKEETTANNVKPSAKFLDKITVKNGSEIHIIKLEELMYIQAYGDYVMLFSSTGKYIKELTMKYLEANLPDSFIRIHRSHIVNTDFIARVELFGKETYHIRLKSGIYLQASNNGYKLLKDKLLL